jgi:hypothetical protein
MADQFPGGSGLYTERSGFKVTHFESSYWRRTPVQSVVTIACKGREKFYNPDFKAIPYWRGVDCPECLVFKPVVRTHRMMSYLGRIGD